jgi:hypothetical protein
MMFQGPVNNLRLTEKEATDYFHNIAKRFIYSPYIFKDKTLKYMEKYLKSQHKLQVSITKLIDIIADNISVYIDKNNNFYAIIKRIDYPQVIDCDLDTVSRLITYGNSDVEGYPILEEMCVYIFKRF